MVDPLVMFALQYLFGKIHVLLKIPFTYLSIVL